MKSELWLGSAASAESYVRYLDYRNQNPLALTERPRMGLFDDEEESDDEGDNPIEPKFNSYLIKDFGNVGVITIKGGLTNDDDWLVRWFGLTSYAEIIRAASELMADEEITDIVLDIDSGGGTVSGLDDVSRSLVEVGKVKTVHSATSGAMASAAYWIGVTASKISTTEMAQLGSIGVIAAHFSISKMLEEEGIKVTVLRAGKQKSPGSPYEELSERDESILQKELDTLHGFFLNHVSANRELSLATKESWGEGQMFFGQEAVAIGLADQIKSPERLVVSLEASDPVDKSPLPANNVPDEQNRLVSNNAGESEMSLEPRRTVILQSEADLAAVAAGAPLAGFEHQEAEAIDPPENVEAAAAEGASAEAALAAAAEANADEAATPPQSDTAVLSNLLSDKAAENALLKRDLETAQAAQKQSEALLGPLAGIAAESANRMEVPLRMAATDFTGLAPAAVITKYEAVREAFYAQFKVGRQTEQAMNEPENVVQLGIVPLQKG